MKVLNLLATSGIGGIEVLCKDLGRVDSDNTNTFCTLFEEGIIYEKMCEGGNNPVSLSNIGGKLSFRKLCKLIALAKAFDIISIHHGSLLMYLYFLGLCVALPKKKKVLFHHSCFDDLYSGSHIKKALAKLEIGLAIKLSDRFVYVSNAVKQSFLQAFSVDEKKTNVVYNGINDDFISIGRNNVPKFNGEIRMLYIGRLVNVKGVHLLLEAVSELRLRYNVFLRIVGTGKDEQKLKADSVRLGIADIVSFEGVCIQNDPFYREANCFIYPSVWQEAFGISIIEAMAYGLPCIANRVGGIPEIIKDEKNGFLTSEATPAGIVAAVEKCLFMSDCAQVSASAKETATQFSIQNTREHLHNIYSELRNTVG